MALSSAVRVPISGRIAGLSPTILGIAPPLAWATLLTLLVAGPWLQSGYLFGTDWPGPKRILFPTEVSSSAPLQAILALASSTIGGEATGKLFVFGILFSAAMLAYAAISTEGFIPGAVAATIYVVNPFVYGRLHYGQLFLLAGYAVLPWVAVRLRRLLLEPRASNAMVCAVSLVLLGVLSLHLLLASAVLIAPLVVAWVAAAKRRLNYLKELTPALLLVSGTALVVSAYWIVPLLNGRGFEGSRLAGIALGDLNAFAAIPDPHLGLLSNLLGLYGFWAENSGRFTSMKAFVPLWPTILAVLFFVAGIGTVAALRRWPADPSPWVAGLVVAGAIALVLEMGISQPLTATLVTWLDAHFVLYRGMRDAGKWAALVALVYSQLLGLGTATVLAWVRRRVPDSQRVDWVASVAAGLLLALPLYYGNGLLFGAHGEIKPSQYPSGWYAADRLLASDNHPGRTLFLPWHEYMSFGFIRNQNRVVAPPGPTFFSVPVLVSSNPEVPGISPPDDPDQVAVTSLVGAGDRGDWARTLADRNVKYVLLARELDWNYFTFLDDQPGLSRVGDFGSIVVYRNYSVP